MFQAQFASALMFVFQLGAPIVAAIVFAAILAGVFKTVTLIEDGSISFACKMGVLVGVMFVAGGYFWTQIVQYTNGVWGYSQTYI